MRVTWVGCLVLLLAGPVGAQNERAGSLDSKASTPEWPSVVGGKSLAEWKTELKSPDASRRSMAIVAITQFGDPAAECVPLILERCQDTDVSPRSKALMALRNIAVEEKDVRRLIDTVARRLNPQVEPQAVVRYEAALTLRRYLKDAAPAIPSLITGTTDKASWEIRHICAATLWQTVVSIPAAERKGEGPDQRAVEALLNLLRMDKTYQVRLETLQGLGAMGRPENPQLLGKLISELDLCSKHTNRPLAIWAYAGLVAMQDGPAAEASLAAISKFLKSTDIDTRVQAIAALGGLGKQARSRVPALMAMLDDKDGIAVQTACSALANIGEKSDRVVYRLLELVNHKDPVRAAGAISALVTLRADPPRVIAVLDKLLEKKDLDIRLRFMTQQGITELKKPVKK
ncbi:MAG: hypothetical protein U0736_15335 [Gemmataceae bacterium]